MRTSVGKNTSKFGIRCNVVIWRLRGKLMRRSTSSLIRWRSTRTRKISHTMSVTCKGCSEQSVTSKYKIEVVVLSDDEEDKGNEKAAAVHKETEAVGKTRSNGSPKTTPCKDKTCAMLLDAYYKRNMKPLNTSNKRCSSRAIGGPSKRTLIEHRTPAYIVLDSSDESTQTP